MSAKAIIHDFFALFERELYKTEVVVTKVHAALVKHGHRVHCAAADDEVAAGEFGTKKR